MHPGNPAFPAILKSRVNPGTLRNRANQAKPWTRKLARGMKSQKRKVNNMVIH